MGHRLDVGDSYCFGRESMNPADPGSADRPPPNLSANHRAKRVDSALRESLS